MARGIPIVCDTCGEGVMAWDDGNPYYIDLSKWIPGKRPRSRCKVYVHHPHVPDWPIVGNDEPHLCLACAHSFNIDSERPRTTCTKCASNEIAPLQELADKQCPWCKGGILRADFGQACVS